jgi:hypothetical protein
MSDLRLAFRHPEVAATLWRPSKGDGHGASAGILRGSLHSHLRMTDNGAALLILAMQLHPSFCSNGTKRASNQAYLFASPDNEGSGAPNGAGVENRARYQARPRPFAGPLTFRRSTAD